MGSSTTTFAKSVTKIGEPRQVGSSHRIYKTLWQGNLRVNIQNDKGMAKAYQVKQVLKAIERLEKQENVEE